MRGSAWTILRSTIRGDELAVTRGFASDYVGAGLSDAWSTWSQVLQTAPNHEGRIVAASSPAWPAKYVWYRYTIYIYIYVYIVYIVRYSVYIYI